MNEIIIYVCFFYLMADTSNRFAAKEIVPVSVDETHHATANTLSTSATSASDGAELMDDCKTIQASPPEMTQ